MPQSVIQTAFHAGELAPTLYARVDIGKYHQALATCRNFYVDYRGGVSTRVGTKYILQAYKSSSAVRLIPFSASFTTTYVLEFGDFYIRFYTNGAAVLEATTAITGATQANPCVITDVAHSYAVGDWVYITGVVGMTQLNGHYFSITAVTANTFTIADLNGVAINSTAYTAYSSGGTAARVYTLTSPYAAADLALLKFAQDVSTMVLVNSNYVPYVLTFISGSNWTLNPIVFGSSIAAPTGVGATVTGGAITNYSFVMTAVDVNNQESVPSTAIAATGGLPAPGVSVTVTWTAVTGAQFYNIYQATIVNGVAVPAFQSYGFLGFSNAGATTFTTTNILPNFDFTPPISRNPFIAGSPVDHLTITNQGAYAPIALTATIGAPSSGGIQATVYLTFEVSSITSIAAGGSSYIVGDVLTNASTGTSFTVSTVGGAGDVTAATVTTRGTVTITMPTNPFQPLSGGHGTGAQLNLNWRVKFATMIQQGSGYASVPAVTFSSGAAAATAVLGVATTGNPSVAAYFDQRLVLAGPAGAPQTFYMSKPGSSYNFDVSIPTQADDSIVGSIKSGQLNTIKSMLPMSAGLVMLSSRQAWLVNGGSAGAAVSAIDTAANSQAYNGASDVPPIVSNFDILYVQAKGSIVRDLTFNFYTNIYTGTDISVLSSHLFYGYTLTEWAYAEEPFKVVWAVRSDGTLLSLTFVKEQEIVGWARHDTTGTFKSVATVTETTSTVGAVDAIYVVVQRTINGNTVQYIERMAERIFPNGVTDAWCVDAGIQYSGSPATSFTGAEHLAGATVTGLADGLVITPFVMPTTGNFTLSPAASKVTVGLAFSPQIQTLALDIGEPTIQAKRKKNAAVDVRVNQALGLSIGTSLANVVPMKDLVIGNVGTISNSVVSGLVSGDARTVIDPVWDAYGQYYITQPNPFPATILGVIPETVTEDRR